MKGKKKALAGTRRVQKVGGSLMIALPADFVESRGIKEGDDLPYAANHMIAYVPVKGVGIEEEQKLSPLDEFGRNLGRNKNAS